jgi:hypothetical protein
MRCATESLSVLCAAKLYSEGTSEVQAHGLSCYPWASRVDPLMTSAHVDLQIDAGVALLTFYHPPVNALNPACES